MLTSLTPSARPKRLTFSCCFASTETVRLIRDGEPRTATSTFTQPLSSEGLNKNVNMLLNVHRSEMAY